jgi:hypothetical protein
MKQLQFDEVRACLPTGKTSFYYHRDRYVLYLLQRLQHNCGMRTIRDVKKSRYAHWLNKPFIKAWLASIGRDDVSLDELLYYWPKDTTASTYLLSLGQWGNETWDTWYQTSRAGINAVLQLNLPFEHQKVFEQQGIEQIWRASRWHHPMSENRLTMAWARLDWDWQTGQAIIEEIQSDWLRDYPELLAEAVSAKARGESSVWRGGEIPLETVFSYQPMFAQHQKTWSEAMLTAALWFLQQELGFKEVFYHGWQTGNAVKRLGEDHVPPRSLYTELPEKFAFERVNQGPLFLERDPKVKKVKKRQDVWQWYRWAA